jgi:signal peptidase I
MTSGDGALSAIPIKGDSMWPSLRSGDRAVFEPLGGPPREGEVLVVRMDGALVAHRVVSVRQQHLTLKGDNCDAPDGPVRLDHVLGIITRVERDGRTLTSPQWDVGPKPLGLWRRRLRQRGSVLVRLLRKVAGPAAALALFAGCSEGQLTLEEPVMEKPGMPVELGVGSTSRRAPVELIATGSLERSPAGAERVGDLKTLTVRVQMEGFKPGTMAVEFMAPGDVPFQRKTARLSGLPIEEHAFSLPVAGTLIDTNNLSGRWAARLTAHGKTVSTWNFELKP